MSPKKKQYSPQFKAKVAIEAVEGVKTIAERIPSKSDELQYGKSDECRFSSTLQSGLLQSVANT